MASIVHVGSSGKSKSRIPVKSGRLNTENDLNQFVWKYSVFFLNLPFSLSDNLAPSAASDSPNAKPKVSKKKFDHSPHEVYIAQRVHLYYDRCVQYDFP